MGTTTKVLRKVATIKESSPGTYEVDPDVLLPHLSWGVGQSFNVVEDESIVGYAFPDLPLQGVRLIAGDLNLQADVITLESMLEWVFGNVNAKVFALPNDKNEIANSFVMIDEVKTYKYQGCYCPSCEFSSSPGGDLKYTAGLIGWKAESRDDTSFPTMSYEPGTRLMHHHMSSTGYFRIANHDAALDSDDNENVGDISIGINWNFDNQFVNAQQTLQPLSGAGGRPGCTFNFQVARHTADTYHGFRDNATKLQAELYYYASATAALKFQLPNLLITDVAASDDDVTQLDITCAVGRNGIGTSYTNSNMSFLAPVKATLTNS